MKRLFVLFLLTVFTVISVNAQNETKNGKVVLKTGAEVEGTIQMQGTDVIVTTAAGDMFYFTTSEISKISTGESKQVKQMPDNKYSAAYNKHTVAVGLKSYKRDAKTAYKELKTLGKNEFWNENVEALFYYEKYRRINTAAWITGSAGFFSTSLGVPMICGGSGSVQITGICLTTVGCASLITSWILPACANSSLKKSYQYHAEGGNSHAINVSAAPVFYAQGGAGIGVSINF